MAKEKKPSIYVDRGTIGSSDELDEYGVWVKSEPQDLSAAGIKVDESPGNDDNDDFDFDIPDMDSLPDFDALQAEADALRDPVSGADDDADDDFTLPDMDMDLEIEEDSDSASADGDVFNFGDFTQPVDTDGIPDDITEDTLDETDSALFAQSVPNPAIAGFGETTVFSLSDDDPDFTTTEISGASNKTPEEPETLPEDDEDFDEISLDDLIEPTEDEPETGTEESLDALDETPEEPAALPVAISGEDSFDEISMDDLVEPAQDEPETGTEESFDEISMDDMVEPAQNEPETVTEESFDEISLDNLVEPTEDEPSEGFEDLILEDGDSIDAGNTNDFPDINDGNFAADFSGINDAPAAEPKEKTPDLSTQLLLKIAEELSSIRTELTSLKKEFSGIKAVTAAEDPGMDYYGTEDDEKISLTGDELNNILNTADFTEETGADATITLAEDLNISGDDEVFSPEEEPFSENLDIFADTPVDLGSGEDEPPAGVDSDFGAIEDLDMEFDLGKADLDILEGTTKLGNSGSGSRDQFDPLDISGDLIPDFSADETGKLDEIRENGVEPITAEPDPEDTDYLIEDPLAEAPSGTGFGVEEIPLDVSTNIISDDFLSDDSIDTHADVINVADIDNAVFDSGDLLSDDSVDSIDLSDAVIDEPDLSLDIHDNPIEEPSLEDISIDLDLSELEMEAEEPDFDEMDLGEELVSDELDSLTLETEELEPFGPDTEEPIFDLDSEPDSDLSLISDDFDGELPEIVPADGFSAADLGAEEISPEQPFEELLPDELPAEEITLDELPPLFEENGGELETLETEEAAPEEIEEIEEIGEPISVESPAAHIAKNAAANDGFEIPGHLKQELKTVLSYMDRLLEALPNEKIEEFARSEYYDTYKKLFKDLGLV